MVPGATGGDYEPEAQENNSRNKSSNKQKIQLSFGLPQEEGKRAGAGESAAGVISSRHVAHAPGPETKHWMLGTIPGGLMFSFNLF